MATAEEEQHNAAAYPRPAYAWYVVVLMMFFYVLSFMDRQIIAVRQIGGFDESAAVDCAGRLHLESDDRP
jgi:hypothetical protein